MINRPNNMFLFSQTSGSGAFEPDAEWLALEQKLRERALLIDPDIQWLAALAATRGLANSQWARNKIRLILEGEQIEDMRTENAFRPPAPAAMLSQGQLHLFHQADGLAWLIPLTALTRGVFLTGPQGSGKSRLLVYLCWQLSRLGIPYTVIDPKEGLKAWADYINARYYDISAWSLDFKPPAGTLYETFLPALMPQLADIIGVVYGTEILQQAASICIELRNRYVQQTGTNTEISLQDIYQALPLVSEVSKGRRYGYREAVSTGLSRILTGSGELFKCRKGVDLSILLNQNNVLGCADLTDEFATRWLPVYLLEWVSFESRNRAPTDAPKRVFIFDDASRYLAARGAFERQGSTSSLTHLLAKLRSTGNCTLFTTQIPHMSDAGVLALSHTVVCVGGLQYGPDTKILAEMMGLSPEQRIALSRLRKRQAVGICGSCQWTRPVHGYTVDVPDRGEQR